MKVKVNNGAELVNLLMDITIEEAHKVGAMDDKELKKGVCDIGGDEYTTCNYRGQVILAHKFLSWNSFEYFRKAELEKRLGICQKEPNRV